MKCRTCGQEGVFAKRHKICNSCRAKRHKAVNTQNPKYYLRKLLWAAQRRARQRGLECTLTLDQLEQLWKDQKGRCALSGIVLTHAAHGTERRFSASIDRIDSKGHYVIENVQLVCARVNLMKSDLDTSDFQWWIKTLNAQLGGEE